MVYLFETIVIWDVNDSVGSTVSSESLSWVTQREYVVVPGGGSCQGESFKYE